MALTLRPARATDRPRLRALLHRAYGHYVPRIGFRPPPMDADCAAAIADGRVDVAEDNGVVVGLIVVQPNSDHLLIENVAVEPSSQLRGVGQVFLRRAEHRAADLGLPEVRLFTHVAMTENRAFYARRGYRETGRRTDQGVERVFFAKSVASHAATSTSGPERRDGERSH